MFDPLGCSDRFFAGLVAAAAGADAPSAWKIEDGWLYFIHGWTRVMAEVFQVDIPTSGPIFDDLCLPSSDTDRLLQVTQRILDHNLVLRTAEKQADRRLIVGMA